MGRPSPSRPVVVTGLGAITPLGNGVDALHEGWLAGRSGIEDGLGRCGDYDPTTVLSRKEARRADRCTQLALSATAEALADAGWADGPPVDPDRVAVVLGTGVGGFTTMERGCDAVRDGRPVSALTVPLMMANAPAGAVAQRHGFRGPSFGTVSACAAGAHAIGTGLALLRAGACDAVVVGGTEAAITDVARASFAAMEATSPTGRSRPFHAERDGFVLAEGAGILVLEREDDAEARGARSRGRLLGWGASSDAHHLTAPHPEGAGAARSVIAALHDAGVTAADVAYVNAHGTGTPLNDRAEAHALHAALGARVVEVPVSSAKSAIGHTLGAAGAIEAVATLRALADGRVAPTVGLDVPDPEIHLRHVVDEPFALAADGGGPRVALSTSFGFGGHNACLALAA